ncbi:MAG: hypothetical protein RLY86_1208 [Pseudomonadota bacterium]|jgi:hypothetical protein
MDHRIPDPPLTAADLYEADYYAWVLGQAAALRALAGAGGAGLPLDLENLADEVEDMGRSQLRGVLRLIEQVLIHLLKLRAAPDALPARHWRREISNFRRELRSDFTRSMRPRVLEALPDRYQIARNRTLSALEGEVADLEQRLPADCPWTLDQILSADDPDRV